MITPFLFNVSLEDMGYVLIYHLLEDVSVAISSFLWRHSPGSPINDRLAALIDARRSELRSVSLRKQLEDLYSGGQGVPNSDRGDELDLLGKIDGAVSGKKIAKHCGKESDGQGAVGDPSFEVGFLSVGFVEVDGIKVSNGPGEELDILFCDPFGEFSGIADL